MGAIDTRDLTARLLGELPDVPRWIETRAILRSPDSQVFAGPVLDDGVVVRLVHGAMSVVSVIGHPPAYVLAAAIDGTTAMTPVVAQQSDAAHVDELLSEIGSALDEPGWRRERMLFHSLTSVRPLPPLDAGVSIRLLTRDDPLDHLPPGLRHEMSHARVLTATAAAVVDGVAASFCYACFTTESLWDVSIDTLEEYRGRGLAAHTVRFMIDRMREQRLEPTWGALESNGASLGLAARLGFAPVVDTNIVFSRGPWAYLTGGFRG